MTIQNAILSKRRIHCTKDPFLLINIPMNIFRKVFYKTNIWFQTYVSYANFTHFVYGI